MKVFVMVLSLLLLFGCRNDSSQSLPPGSLQKTDIIDAVRHGAVCNDGSPTVYYFQPATSSSSQDWVIHFQGGGRCSAIAGCKIKSSNGWENTLLGEGILSDIYSVNPYFYQSNHVYLRQCSSDGWTGQKSAGSGSNNIIFKGSYIFKRVIQDLINNSGLGSAHRVLLSGASSGTQGVLQHLDWLSSKLPQAQVKGVMDAGFFIDVPTYSLSTVDAVNVSIKKYKTLHASFGDADCLQAYATNPSACLLPDVVIPYITTPLLVVQSQKDPVILSKYGVSRPYDSNELLYINQYVASLKASLNNQPLVFSSAKARHTTIARLRFPLQKIGQVYFSTYLGEWFYQTPQPTSIIE